MLTYSAETARLANKTTEALKRERKSSEVSWRSHKQSPPLLLTHDKKYVTEGQWFTRVPLVQKEFFIGCYPDWFIC